MIGVRIDVAGHEAIPPDEACSVVVAVTEDDLNSEVRRGENAGRKLHHAGVVRSLERAGDMDPAHAPAPIEHQVKLDPSWKREHLHLIAFVQSASSLRIYGAATAPLPASDKTP